MAARRAWNLAETQACFPSAVPVQPVNLSNEGSTVDMTSDDSPRPLRIGAVSYLNTKPLICGLAEDSPAWRLELDLPSRLADRLDEGSLDVALIPSIAYWQRPGYRIVSNACIGCRGPVLSVKLLARCPMSQVETLALDEGSRTSVALSRILLSEKLAVNPRIEPFPIGQRLEDTTADAVLIIGDRAMHVDESQFVETWDLGRTWVDWSRLPFVFAMWVARPGVETGLLESILAEARDRGVESLPMIAAEESAKIGWPADRCLTYLKDHLHFTLGPEEWSGLQLFYDHAVRRDLAPAGWNPLPSEVVVP